MLHSLLIRRTFGDSSLSQEWTDNQNKDLQRRTLIDGLQGRSRQRKGYPIPHLHSKERTKKEDLAEQCLFACQDARGSERDIQSLTLRRSLYVNQNQQFTKVDCWFLRLNRDRNGTKVILWFFFERVNTTAWQKTQKNANELQQTCSLFGVFPLRYRAWGKLIFQKGKRGKPPYVGFPLLEYFF